MPALVHLIYASAATRPIEEEEILQLLSGARRHNHEIGVTGMLLYSEGSFFQVLEGEATVVEELFEMISRDGRHERITRIIQETIHDRAFGDWSMAYTGATPEQLGAIEGLNDFFAEGTCLADIDAGRAKKLLKAFSAGRWRQSLG
jgi:hypothetical protein